MPGKKPLMLVLCFNLLSFGGRELSSKYSQHSAKAQVFDEHPVLSVHAESTTAEGLYLKPAAFATVQVSSLCASHLQFGSNTAVNVCL